MKYSILFSTMDVIIGNGCGRHTFIANRHYSLKSLQADYRLTDFQIRKYFRSPLSEKAAK